MDDVTMMGDEEENSNFHLRWHHYEVNMMQVFERLFREESFVDVTLVCPAATAAEDVEDLTLLGNMKKNHLSVKAHKIILSACSPFFRRLLLENPCRHPVVILPREVTAVDLRYLIEFVYRGEVDVPKSQMESLLKAAEVLQIRGLSENELFLDKEMATGGNNSGKPSQVMSHAQKRKSSPKFRFLKSKRKRLRPVRYGAHEVESEEEEFPSSQNQSFEDESAELPYGEEEDDDEEEEHDDEGEEEEEDLPVDFTMKTEVNEEVAEELLLSNDRNQSDIPTDNQAANATSPSGFTNGSSPSLVSQSISPYFAAAAFAANKQYDLSSSRGNSPFTAAKAYTKRDMNMALDALRLKKLTLTRASELYGIPPTTLWQRANRMGISTPKKETVNKTWSEADLERALESLRRKELSANKAAKRYGIPSSTLYKIARKERIELAQPFNAVQTSWSQDDLNKALTAIRKGTPVQKAAADNGIPSGTLYGRCKKVGIELSKTTAVHWSEGDMNKALDSVRSGGMSINQAAIHHNLPYSSLYGRINRLKRDQSGEWGAFNDLDAFMAAQHQHAAAAAGQLMMGAAEYSPFSRNMNYVLEQQSPPRLRRASSPSFQTRQLFSSPPLTDFGLLEKRRERELADKTA